MSVNDIDNHLVSVILAVILFSFALYSTSRNYIREREPERKQQYLVLMVLSIILVIIFAFGMWYIS